MNLSQPTSSHPSNAPAIDADLLEDLLLVRAAPLEGLVRHGEEGQEPEDDHVQHEHAEAVPLGLAAPAEQVQVPVVLGVGHAGEGQHGEGLGVALVHLDEARLHDPAQHGERGHPGAQPGGEGAGLEDQARGQELKRGHDADGDVGGLERVRHDHGDLRHHRARQHHEDEAQNHEPERVGGGVNVHHAPGDYGEEHGVDDLEQVHGHAVHRVVGVRGVQVARVLFQEHVVVSEHVEDELGIGDQQEHRADAQVGDHTGRGDILVNPAEEQCQDDVHHHGADDQLVARQQRKARPVQQDAALEQ
eukprot:Colp12_sorted_trinity150504_noHs@14140